MSYTLLMHSNEARQNITATKALCAKARIRTLRLRARTYRAELATCTTAAARRCVLESLEGVLAELSANGVSALEVA